MKVLTKTFTRSGFPTIVEEKMKEIGLDFPKSRTGVITDWIREHAVKYEDIFPKNIFSEQLVTEYLKDHLDEIIYFGALSMFTDTYPYIGYSRETRSICYFRISDVNNSKPWTIRVGNVEKTSNWILKPIDLPNKEWGDIQEEIRVAPEINITDEELNYYEEYYYEE